MEKILNKKFLLFSDSHGGISALKNVFDWAKDHIPPNDTISAAVCLGDGLADISKAADAAGFFSDWKIVRGNNDYMQAPEADVYDFAGSRFFLCHGHRYGLYGGTHALAAAAKNNNANAALFGHTHVPFYKNSEGIIFINPGSVSRPRSRIGATFAVIECIEGGPLDAIFYGIGGSGGIYRIKVQN